MTSGEVERVNFSFGQIFSEPLLGGNLLYSDCEKMKLAIVARRCGERCMVKSRKEQDSKALNKSKIKPFKSGDMWQMAHRRINILSPLGRELNSFDAHEASDTEICT